MYAFERALLRMSGVGDDAPFDDRAREKLRLMWREYRQDIICDTPLFHGSVGFYAINNNFPEFLEMLIGKYGLDFNFPDKETQRTPLDFLHDELERLRLGGLEQSADAQALRGYYSSFRSMGMQRVSELSGG